MKPCHQPLCSAPLDDKTTNRVDYLKWPSHPPERHQPDPYCPPAIEMASITNNRFSYDSKPLSKREPCLPSRRLGCPGKFEDATTNRVDYRQLGPVPLYRHQPDPYCPPGVPFEGLPIYRTDYVGRCQPPRASMKPCHVPLESAPLQDCTEYRQEFTKKCVPACIAGLLEAGAGNTGLCYADTDPVGHKFFESCGAGCQSVAG